jgi:hypothetical protein
VTSTADVYPDSESPKLRTCIELITKVGEAGRNV